MGSETLNLEGTSNTTDKDVVAVIDRAPPVFGGGTALKIFAKHKVEGLTFGVSVNVARVTTWAMLSLPSSQNLVSLRSLSYVCERPTSTVIIGGHHDLLP